MYGKLGIHLACSTQKTGVAASTTLSTIRSSWTTNVCARSNGHLDVYFLQDCIRLAFLSGRRLTDAPGLNASNLEALGITHFSVFRIFRTVGKSTVDVGAQKCCTTPAAWRT